MKTVIITGMSGAGKTTAVHMLEDIGYYCVDNIPPVLISSFVSLCENSNFHFKKIALVVDARSGDLVKHLSKEIDSFKKRGNECSVIFLDADDKTLIKRYKDNQLVKVYSRCIFEKLTTIAANNDLAQVKKLVEFMAEFEASN